MLSIHSLAASLSTDSNWLLNNAELSRVRWRKGAREGELIVEIDRDDDVEDEPLELYDVKGGAQRARTPVIHQTRVGVYDDVALPGVLYPNRTMPKITFNGGASAVYRPMWNDLLMMHFSCSCEARVAPDRMTRLYHSNTLHT